MSEEIKKDNPPTPSPTLDVELLKSILLDTGEIPNQETVTGFSYENKLQKDVDKGTRLLIEESFIHGFHLKDNINFFRIIGLTEKGKQFVDKAKNEVTWEKTIKILSSKENGAITIRTLQDALVKATEPEPTIKETETK